MMTRPCGRIGVEAAMASVWMATTVMVRWALPHDAAPSGYGRVARVCGGTINTVNAGSCVPM
jgi:hypothetical protein